MLPAGPIRGALLRADPEGADYLRFSATRESWAANLPEELAPLLEAIERGAADGLWAVGFVAYEAAPGLDAALPVRPPADAPLAAFALFDAPERVRLDAPPSPRPWLQDLVPALAEVDHRRAVERALAAIGDGETYQVNLTLPIEGRTRLEPEALFAALAPPARAPYSSFLDLGERAIVSLSPELFFERERGVLRMRPMKGTRPRGRFLEEDAALAAELAAAEKDRAENLMIVDMARNDLGRVADAGSVAVSSLYDVERYPTVWQATSTVEARSGVPLAEIFRALFPCCSVTGAPKRAAMSWIERLEKAPRGIYCGAIGRVEPGGKARFSVAIRTAVVERATGRLSYGVGSGIVWDSDASAEWRECLDKARALEPADEDFALFETIFWSPRCGAPLLARHLARLSASAARFERPCDLAAVERAFRERIAALPATPHRVRVDLAVDGRVAVRAEPFERRRERWKLALVGPPAAPDDVARFHKTTRRAPYDRALEHARDLGADEALLFNTRGELTEGARTNLVVEIDGRRWTPALDGGLLPGIYRGRLLERRRVTEARLGAAELARASRIWMVNALRGAIPVTRVLDAQGAALWRSRT